MRIVELETHEDWLASRDNVITGTKAKETKPLARGKNLPMGIYGLLAEAVAAPKEFVQDETPIQRGHRLESIAVEETAKKYKLKLRKLKPQHTVLWLSDDGKIGVSPDADEDSDNPTYAVEAKAFDAPKHLMAVLNDWNARKLPNYNPLNSLKIGKEDYSQQVTQYFINPDLQTVYFTLKNEQIIFDNVAHYVIEVKREHVQEFLDAQIAWEYDAIEKVNRMIETLKEIK